MPLCHSGSVSPAQRIDLVTKRREHRDRIVELMEMHRWISPGSAGYVQDLRGRKPQFPAQVRSAATGQVRVLPEHGANCGQRFLEDVRDAPLVDHPVSQTILAMCNTTDRRGDVSREVPGVALAPSAPTSRVHSMTHDGGSSTNRLAP